MNDVRIIDTNSGNILGLGICGYKHQNRPGLLEKVNWLNDRFKEGLKVKTLFSEKDGNQGMIEYIPGEFCWRPVDAAGYMFIHCLFAGFRKPYKKKGYASLLLDQCESEAEEEEKFGVAVVTRKSSFMVGKEIFIKRGYQVVDEASPDFELVVKIFQPDADPPKFRENFEEKAAEYGEGLTIIRADQCPYTVKNVNEILDTAEKEYRIKTKIVHLRTAKEAQNSPCAFGTFCILYEGKVIVHHPISNTRFKNIMNKILN